MKILLLSVGRPRRLFADAIAEYEGRIRRYFTFDSAEVREEPFRRGADRTRVLDEEAKRLLARRPPTLELVALTREGSSWSSERLANYLSGLGLHGAGGAAFVIGGALGLGHEILREARHQLSLSALTLPHELARLVLSEQLYRAGTIIRGEPYHKGSG